MSGPKKQKAAPAPMRWGMMAEFETPGDLLHACEKFRDAGFSKWDAYSPFPIHGLDEAMGLKASRVSILVGTGAILGVASALALQGWTSGIDYPMVTAGKPYAAWEPFTPITFELGVLFASFSAILGMLVLNRLPQWWHPLMLKSRFLKVSDDRFVLAVEASDPKFDETQVRRLLESVGGTHIDVVEA